MRTRGNCRMARKLSHAIGVRCRIEATSATRNELLRHRASRPGTAGPAPAPRNCAHDHRASLTPKQTGSDARKDTRNPRRFSAVRRAGNDRAGGLARACETRRKRRRPRACTMRYHRPPHDDRSFRLSQKSAPATPPTTTFEQCPQTTRQRARWLRMQHHQKPEKEASTPSRSTRGIGDQTMRSTRAAATPSAGGSTSGVQ